MVPAPLPIAPGDLLGEKYRIESVLGRGGMGVVFAAVHVRLEQRVAIKFLLEEAGAHPEMRERFAREARAASKIRSEHVARVLDVGVMGSGVPYTVMEYLEGEDLARTLRRRGALPVTEAVGYLLQACEALAEAHVAGIVHRDLKPANVFLARRADGSVSVKLLDFGISKVVVEGADGGAITHGATILGSPRYMPPEQIRSTRDVDARGDLWSLGATLFELVAGQPAFQADTLPELCVRILEEPAPELEHLVPQAPPGLSGVLHRCLAKERTARYATVAELAAALGPFGPPGCAVSVDRVARIVAAAGPSKPHRPPEAASDQEIERLQDATTMKACEGTSAAGALGEDTAHSVVSSNEPRSQRGKRFGIVPALAMFPTWARAAAILLWLAMMAAGIVVLRRSAKLSANGTPVATSQPTAQRDPASAPPLTAGPASVDSENGPSPAERTAFPATSVAPTAPPLLATEAAVPRGSTPPGALAASAIRRAKERESAREKEPAKAASSSPSSTLPGTEGFGDRK
jgi:serine/threonine protein kinase